MASKQRRGSKSSETTAPQREYPDGYITTLHPEGSFDGTKQYVETRELSRPNINYWIAALNVITSVLIFFALSCWNIRYALIFIGLYTLIRLRKIVIWFIRLYQRYASDDIRLSCVFTPSCSEYMILSIRRYGVIRGCVKGIKRLKRCHYPNGGEDYP